MYSKLLFNLVLLTLVSTVALARPVPKSTFKDYLGKVVVRLSKGSGQLVKQVLVEPKYTAFEFKDLPPGRYCITTGDPSNKYVNGPVGPDNKLGTYHPGYCFELPSYEDPFYVKLGFVEKEKANVILGNAFMDWNRNGIQETDEPFLDGINVTLKSADGTFTSPPYSVAAKKNGLEIIGILSGMYCLTVNDTTGRYQVGPYGPGEGNMVDAFSHTYCLNIPDQNEYITLGFTEKPKTYSFIGSAFNDVNKDGEYNKDEGYLEGIVVTVVDGSGDSMNVTLEAKYDALHIKDIPEGRYCILASDPSGNYTHSPFGKDNKVISDKSPYCFELPGLTDPFELHVGFFMKPAKTGSFAFIGGSQP
eukprot:gene2279-2585_t